MENRHLTRRINNMKRDFDDTVDDLILEIEDLERDRNRMQDEIDRLKDQIEELQENK